MKNKKKNLNILIFKDNHRLLKKIVFSQYDEEKSLSIGLFSSPIKIESNIEYTIKFYDISGLLFIANYEEYNQNSKIKICSSNSETILACFIV